MIHAFQFNLNKNIENAFKEMEAYSLQNLYLNQISEKKLPQNFEFKKL